MESRLVPSARAAQALSGSLRLVLSVTFLLSMACAGDDHGPDALTAFENPDVIAVFHAGQITAEEVDEAILALPASDRNNFRGTDAEPFRKIVRELAIENLLVAEAKESGFATSPELTREIDALRRQVLVQHVLQQSPLDIELPTEEEIRHRYEISRQSIGEPEQRYVMTIFRRRDPGQDPSPLVAEMEGLRQRVLDGESFKLLAKEHSDSESRHQEGMIGAIRRGQVPAALEEILFTLDEGVPSEPIVTREGVHLFFVETIVQAEIPALESVIPEIRQTLLQERQSEAVRRLVADTQLPADAFAPDHEALGELFLEAKPETVLLRLGQYELDFGELQEILAREMLAREGDPRPQSEIAKAIFGGIRQREVLYHRFTSQGESLPASVRERFDQQARTFLIRRYLEHRLRLEAEKDPAELEEYFELHKNRFVTPLELRLRALTIPFGDSPDRLMATLESQRSQVGEGSISLDALAAKLGGELSEAQWTDLARLSTRRPKAAYFAPSLPAGGVSPPYNTGAAIEIFQVVERREPRPLKFEMAREEVRDAYLRRHGQELYETMSEEMLSGASFQISNENLTHLAAQRATGLAANGAPSPTSDREPKP